MTTSERDHTSVPVLYRVGGGTREELELLGYIVIG